MKKVITVSEQVEMERESVKAFFLPVSLGLGAFVLLAFVDYLAGGWAL